MSTPPGEKRCTDHKSTQLDGQQQPHENSPSSSGPVALGQSDSGDGMFTFTPQVCRDMTISPKTAHMLWFSGLRGAVAYACVRSFPDTFGHANDFTMTTMIVVLVSVFALGSTTECMLNSLRIEMNMDESSYMENWYYERPADSCIVQWEDMLHRFVVRGATQDGRVGVPDVDSRSPPGVDEEEEEEEGSGDSPPPVVGDSRRGDKLQRQRGAAAAAAGESQPPLPTAQYASAADAWDDENDHDNNDLMDAIRRNRARRRESVFDYGASS